MPLMSQFLKRARDAGASSFPAQSLGSAGSRSSGPLKDGELTASSPAERGPSGGYVGAKTDLSGVLGGCRVGADAGAKWGPSGY